MYTIEFNRQNFGYSLRRLRGMLRLTQGELSNILRDAGMRSGYSTKFISLAEQHGVSENFDVWTWCWHVEQILEHDLALAGIQLKY